MMARTADPDDQPSLVSRIIGALTALLFGALTVFFVPWLLAWKFPIRLGLAVMLPVVLLLRPFLYLWLAYVAVAALSIGYKAGTYDTVDMLNLIWKTGDSHDPRVHAMASALRQTIILSAIGTFLLFCFS
jgi:hypothetical protein